VRNIDIQTTQNVTIERVLPSVWFRVLAYILDMIILVTSSLLLAAFLGLFMPFAGFGFFFTYLYPFLLFFYTITSEIIWNGQTLGKKALGIRIVRIDGKELSFSDLFIRWSVRFIDIYLSLGSIAFILAGTNLKGQRLGDIMANTTVIKSRDIDYFKLNDILKLNKTSKSEIKYKNVIRLTDHEVLLIKNLLNLLKLYKTDANKQALREMTEKVSYIIGLDKVPVNEKRFLGTVIRDYVALTR
jgi:uncharacterized RDD family membrane protein YckC